MERLISRRNQVFLHEGLVIKKLATKESAQTEAELLRVYHQAGVCVPKVLALRDTEIVMEYIPGETLPDFLARMEANPDDAPLHGAAKALCHWFETFYEAVDYERSGEIRGDVNGRNFIITKDGVLGVDFEERVFGRAEQDIGRLFAFIDTYDLAGMHAKRRFLRLFERMVLGRLQLSTAEILNQYQRERVAMQKRRSPNVNWRPGLDKSTR